MILTFMKIFIRQIADGVCFKLCCATPLGHSLTICALNGDTGGVYSSFRTSSLYHNYIENIYIHIIFIHYRSRSNFGDPNDPNNRLFYGIVTGVAVIGLLSLYQGQYKEITWREFVNNYLNKGVVSMKFA